MTYHVLHVVVNLHLLHAESSDYAHRAHGLISEGCDLSEGLGRDHKPRCNILNEDDKTEAYDRYENNHRQSQAPALDEGNCEAREAHGARLNQLAILLADTHLYAGAVSVHASSKLRVVDLVEPSALLDENSLKESLLDGTNARHGPTLSHTVAEVS